tara:strand:- start:454 stop:579 length:126 start_codon:yes stop_codon:yes gene_type:complete
LIEGDGVDDFIIFDLRKFQFQVAATDNTLIEYLEFIIIYGI